MSNNNPYFDPDTLDAIREDAEQLRDQLRENGDNLRDQLREDANQIREDANQIRDELREDTANGIEINEINNGSSPRITISNTGGITEGQNFISNEQVVSEDITFTYQDASGEQTSIFELSQAEINIFDSDYYLNSNPDVAEEVANKYETATVTTSLVNANVPKINPLGSFQIQFGDNSTVNLSNNAFSVRDYSGAIEHYVSSGAVEGRDPSPLFDSGYYLEQNPDIASALVGGNFSGDPLLHYVSSGAAEGRDPNPYFDSDYYLTQNPGLADAGFNPLEHYVLFGSSQGRDPSPNFDPEFYLSQNSDVAAAGIDPLTHFLTAGQDEGRLPMAV